MAHGHEAGQSKLWELSPLFRKIAESRQIHIRARLLQPRFFIYPLGLLFAKQGEVWGALERTQCATA